MKSAHTVFVVLFFSAILLRHILPPLVPRQHWSSVEQNKLRSKSFTKHEFPKLDLLSCRVSCGLCSFWVSSRLVSSRSLTRCSHQALSSSLISLDKSEKGWDGIVKLKLKLKFFKAERIQKRATHWMLRTSQARRTIIRIKKDLFKCICYLLLTTAKSRT